MQVVKLNKFNLFRTGNVEIANKYESQPTMIQYRFKHICCSVEYTILENIFEIVFNTSRSGGDIFSRILSR